MSDELKPCPFCGFEKPHFMEEGHWIYMACESCGCGGPVSTQMRDPGDTWNTRPLEDALRAELSAAQAEVERLRGIIRKSEWVNPPARVGTYCLHCASPKDRGHHELCPFYQWEAKR